MAPLKRKISRILSPESDNVDLTPARRTRSSGIKPLHIPLKGAPDSSDTEDETASRSSSRAPSEQSLDVKREDESRHSSLVQRRTTSAKATRRRDSSSPSSSKRTKGNSEKSSLENDKSDRVAPAQKKMGRKSRNRSRSPATRVLRLSARRDTFDEDDEDLTPARRTRASGIPPLHIPIQGAPDLSDCDLVEVKKQPSATGKAPSSNGLRNSASRTSIATSACRDTLTEDPDPSQWNGVLSNSNERLEVSRSLAAKEFSILGAAGSREPTPEAKPFSPQSLPDSPDEAGDATPDPPQPVSQGTEPRSKNPPERNVQLNSLSAAVTNGQNRETHAPLLRTADKPKSSEVRQGHLLFSEGHRMQMLSNLSSLLRGDVQSTITFPHQEESFTSLLALLEGTVKRAEGNSCLVLGPRRSGKTFLVSRVLDSLKIPVDTTTRATKNSHLAPIIVKLCGNVHLDDRAALKEIARQILLQDATVPKELVEEQEEGFPDTSQADTLNKDNQPMSLTTRMNSLITALSSLPRPIIFILDAFDLFTAHARQALLYCLFDTVQSCQAENGRKGIAVVGVTSRMDILTLLEKRVKSRFSHRIIRCSSFTEIDPVASIIQQALEIKAGSELWNTEVQKLLASNSFRKILKEQLSFVPDLDSICTKLMTVVSKLSIDNSTITSDALTQVVNAERDQTSVKYLSGLPLPSLTVLVATYHASTTGHDSFTFEHILDIYVRAEKQSSIAGVTLDGVSVGLPRMSRNILWQSLEELVSCGVLQISGVTQHSVALQFQKYRCDVTNSDIRRAVEARDQTQLKRWLTRSH